MSEPQDTTEAAGGRSDSTEVLGRLPGYWLSPSIDDARSMGATGGKTVEAERMAFEAWMRGHCWGLGSKWNGETYIAETETPGKHFDQHAMVTRQLWAAWRDRATLANQGRWA